MDHVSATRRSEIMRSVRRENTSVERCVRQLLFRAGYRFRVNCRQLPGSPDIVFSRKKKVVFVHGCFWHGHVGCPRAKLPKSNALYWSNKIKANVIRDSSVVRRLACEGWESLVVWQCEAKNETQLLHSLVEFLGNPKTPARAPGLTGNSA